MISEDRRSARARFRRREALSVLIAVGLSIASLVRPSGAWGQSPPQTNVNPAVQVESAASDFDTVRELEAVQSQLTRLQAGQPGGAPPLLLDEQRNLVTRLALLLSLENSPAEAEAPLPVPPAPSTSVPPHSTIELDELRDFRDSLEAQVDSLAMRLRNLDGQIDARMTALRKAEEAVRLKADQLAREGGEERRARLLAEGEVARLEARVATLELKRRDRERETVRTRMALLKGQAESLSLDIDRMRADQRIFDTDLERIADGARAARKKLDAQKRVMERQMAQREAAAQGEGQAAKAALREVQALREHVMILNELDLLETGREEIWRQRRAVLEADDSVARTEAVMLLRRSIAQLQSRVRSGAAQTVQARSLLRLQRLRVDGLAEKAPELRSEVRVLQAQQALVETHEIAQEALGRVERLLNRTLDDVSAQNQAQPAPWHEDLTQRVAKRAQALWEYELFSVSDTTRVDGRSVTIEQGVTVGKSVGALVLFFAGWASAWAFSRLVTRWLVRWLGLSEPLGRVMHRWVLSLLVLVVLVAVLKVARIPLTVFAFLGGALAIGVGFGTQNIIKNLISGVIILLERKIRVGDIVTIDSVSGTVTAIDLRATTVRGFDGINAIVPNSLLLENRVSNWSIVSPTVRRSLLVGVGYGKDVRQACAIVTKCARSNPDVLSTPEPEVLFDDFGADAQMLRLQYWVRLGGLRAGPTVDSDLRHAIADAFAEAGLAIPFPQRDVHVDMRMPLKVRLDRRTGSLRHRMR